MRRFFALIIAFAFLSTSINAPAYAQVVGADPMPFMPKPGVMVRLSPEYTPAFLKGIIIHPENALKFDFIVYKGDKELTDAQKRVEYTKLTKYFLASLAIPDDDQWVNLSPYEKDRIIKDDFGKTEMGRDLLAQDYMLKQITASLIYPEDNLGKKFWEKVYAQAQAQYGTTQIPVNTFNKVWILPDDAEIYEKGSTAYVLKNHLRVMLEEDYLSLQKHAGIESHVNQKTNSIASKIVREIVLPELQREVNEGKNFAALRQVYSGMLLATWYKRALKESLLSKIYSNKSKVKGVDQDPKTNEVIYHQYLKAYKKGVFNFIKEDIDKYTNETIPRKYFSGGTAGYKASKAMLGHDPLLIVHKVNFAQSTNLNAAFQSGSLEVFTVATLESGQKIIRNRAMVNPIPGVVNLPFEELDQDKKIIVDRMARRFSNLMYAYRVKPTTLSLKEGLGSQNSRDHGELLYSDKKLFTRDTSNFWDFEVFRNLIHRYNLGNFIERPRGLIVYDSSEYHIRSKETLFLAKEKKYMFNLFIQPYVGMDFPDADLSGSKRNAYIIISFEMDEKTYKEQMKDLEEFPEALVYMFQRTNHQFFHQIEVGFIGPTLNFTPRPGKDDLDHPGFYVPNRVVNPEDGEVHSQKENAFHQQVLTVMAADVKEIQRMKTGRVVAAAAPADMPGQPAQPVLPPITQTKLDDFYNHGQPVEVEVRYKNVEGHEVIAKGKLEEPASLGTGLNNGLLILKIRHSGSGLVETLELTTEDIEDPKVRIYYSGVSATIKNAAMMSFNKVLPMVALALACSGLGGCVSAPPVYRAAAHIPDWRDLQLMQEKREAQSFYDQSPYANRYAQFQQQVESNHYSNLQRIFIRGLRENVIRALLDPPINSWAPEEIAILEKALKFYSNTKLSDWPLSPVPMFSPEQENSLKWGHLEDEEFRDTFLKALEAAINAYHRSNQGTKTEAEPGGIDLNGANLNLQIKRDGKGVPLPIDQQDLNNIHIDGLIPVIIEIKPAMDTPLLSQLQGGLEPSLAKT